MCIRDRIHAENISDALHVREMILNDTAHFVFPKMLLLRTHLSQISYKTSEVLPIYNFGLKYELVNNMRIFDIATDIS